MRKSFKRIPPSDESPAAVVWPAPVFVELIIDCTPELSQNHDADAPSKVPNLLDIHLEIKYPAELRFGIPVL